MPMMAEVGIFTAMNDSQNISEDIQDCDTRDSCKPSSVSSKSNNVIADRNLGDETLTQENSEGIKSSRNGPLPTQDGNDTQMEMEQPRDTMALEVHQTSPNDSHDIASSLGNEEDSRKQSINAENQENNPPNASNLTQTPLGHLGTWYQKQITAPVALPNTITDTTQGNKQGSGSSLPALANRGRVSPYFTRSASKVHLTSSVPQETLTVPSTSVSSLMSGSPTTGSVATSSNPFTTFAISLCQSSEPVPIISASTANNASQTTANNSTSIGVPMSRMMVLPTIPTPLPNLVVMQDNLVSASSIPGHGTILTSLPNLVVKQDQPVSTSPILGHTTIPTPLPNLVVKQDEPVSASSIPDHTTILEPLPNLVVKQDHPVSASSIPSHTLALIPQSVTQTLVTLPTAVSATSTTAVNSNDTPVVIPSLVHKTDDPQSTFVSNAVSTVSSSLSLPSTSSSTMFAMIPAASKSSDPEVPVPVSNDGTASENNTQTPANPCTENSASVVVSTADSVPNIPAIFPGFTPCSKCNSILVCSCAGPSSIGVVPTTCQAACQGVCTCDGMQVDQVGGLNPLQDVKPQIFPAVPLNLLDQLFDGLVEYDKVTKAEQPESITTRLFPYQLQALNWMITRENNTDLAPFWKQVNKRTWFNKGTNMSTDTKPNSPKGGILADDMGLGKTLVVITLIMANHLNGQPMFSKKSSTNKRGASTSGQDGDCKPEPAEKMPRKESNDGDDDGDVVMENKDAVKTVTIKKRKDVADKKKRWADSKTLKQPGFKFRQMYLSKYSSKSIKKEKCKEKKDVPQPKSSSSPIMIDIDNNRGVLVGPWLSAGNDSIGTKGSKKALSDDEHGATLIVCPLSVLSNWTDQICSHVHADVSLQVYMYYGAERLRDINFLRQQDIVLTTYPTLTNDYSRMDSPLHKIKWLRVILDEGHTIRNPQTRLTKAMIDLAAKRRWVLTGTPIQNRLDDLWSVVKFLRLEPFDDKGWWKSSLSSSVRRGDQQAVNRLQKLLKHISIRRLKTDEDDGKPLVKLPPRTVVIQEVELPEEERKLYDAMQKHGQLIIRRYLQDGIVLAKYAHCFAILMRLRQLCLHPKLCAKDSESLQQAQNLLQGLDDSDDEDLDVDHDTQRLIKDLIMTLSSGSDEECSVCLDSLVEPVITRCAHVFCQQCIMDVVTSESLAPHCPLCRAPLNENELIKVPERKKQKPEAEKPSEESAGQSKKSAKLDALIGALSAIRDKDPSIKSLVVSQFTSFLDLIEVELKKEDFTFVRLDGRMTQEARARAIENFSDTSSSSPRVFLLSLTAGGVGLNLTAASRVFLMDPAWNPAIEEQCFDRSHRLGQTQEVIITKYIVMNTVEERMLSLQEQKRTLMGQAFGLQTQSQEDRRRARVRDITHLIGL